MEKMMDKEKNFYEVLNLTKDCKREDIRRSFIEMSKEYHPDRSQNPEYSHEKFLEICKAYKALHDPLRRQRYDECLANRSRDVSNSGKAYGYGTNYGFSSSHSSSNISYSTKLLLKLALLPKAVIVTSLIFISLFGAGIQYNFIQKNFSAKKALLENKTIMSGIIVDHAREQARKYGKEEQLRRLENGLLGQFDAAEILDKYIEEINSKRKH